MTGDPLPLARERDQVISRIGAGGMAEVFLIRRTGPGGFEKFLALKRVRSDLDHATYGPMFLQEAKLVAALQHPNIVQVHDAGADATGLWFLMEYVHGKSVNAIIARALQRGIEIPIECAMYLTACVGRALHYAHHAESATEGRLAVIHRDVSPGNILVSFDGIVKLADFGIARGNHRRSETQDGTFKGKFGYAAPEHCRGEVLDSASDIFSLGIVLHETIAARNLFRGESPSQIVHAVMAAPIPSLCELRHEVPGELDALVHHMLDRDRHARIASGAEVANQLDAIAHGHRLEATRERMVELMRTLFSAQEMRLPVADSAEAGSEPRTPSAAGTGGRLSAARLSAPALPAQAMGSAPPRLPGLHGIDTALLDESSVPSSAALRALATGDLAPGTGALRAGRAATGEGLPIEPPPPARGARTPALLAVAVIAAAAAVLVTYLVLGRARPDTGQAAKVEPAAAPATPATAPPADPVEPAAVPAAATPTAPATTAAATAATTVAPGEPAASPGELRTAEPAPTKPAKRKPRKRPSAGSDPLLERDW